MFRFNLIGIIMFFACGAFTACITDWVLNTENNLIFWGMFGGLVLVIDVIFRAVQKELNAKERWLFADGGGQFIVFPMWFAGLATVIFSVLYFQ